MTKRFYIAGLTLLLAACGDHMGSGDGGDAATDGNRLDVSGDRGGDGSTLDGNAADGDDATPGDDVQPGTDVQPGDDVQNMDVATMDATDGSTPVDVTTPQDVTGATDVPASCGPAPTLTITHPLANTTIETCTQNDMPVYYDFVTAATGSITTIQVNWVVGGTPFAAPVPLTGGPVFTAHRLVGGPATGGMEALFRAQNSLSSQWQFTAIGTDACGRTVSTMVPFRLGYTSQRNRCPNP